jgi:probable F420-dependent oxidoreductase
LRVKFGVHLPHIGPFSDGASMIRFARAAEDQGYDSVWGSDHVVFPVSYESKYPYSETGDFPLPGQVPWVEEVTSLAFVAGATSRIRLGTSILVLPYRNPVMNAKTLAAVDVLSNGRLICGVGAGWMREEAEAMGMPFDDRGARTDEHIEVLKALWTMDEASYEGKHYSLPPVRSEPRPIQKPHPPIWVGGHEPAALRRAARYGNGWHAYRLRADELREKAAYVKQKAEEYGRDPSAIMLSVRAPLMISDRSLSVDRAFAGTPDAIKQQISAFRDAGVEYIVFEPPLMEGIDRSIAACERFIKEVAPEFA